MATRVEEGRVSVIIPTYNEAENICKLIGELEKVLKGYNFEVIVVDDGSPDGTAYVAEQCGKAYGNVYVYDRGARRGLSSAVVYGFNVACGEVYVVMDADFQHPPQLLPQMLDKIASGVDIVIGSRYVCGGGIVGWSFSRRVVSRVAILLAKIFLPKTRGIRDPVSGFFALKRSVIEGIEFTERGFKIILDIIVRGRYGRVEEIPYVFRGRARGYSKLGVNEVISYLAQILTLAYPK